MHDYVPKNWDDLIGVETIRKSIKSNYYNRFDTDKNSYKPILFCGMRGSGKTSMAHIVANDFCKSKENIIDQNCGKFSGAESIREQLDTLSKTSIFGSRRVWILEEMHLLSPTAIQVLLSPLEIQNIPKDLLVIGCTTEPDKIKDTLWDRFNQFKVKSLTNKESLLLYDKVCSTEGFKFNKEFKALIVQKANGNARNLISGILKVHAVESIEEAEYLLDVVAIDEDNDILDLFKLCLACINHKTNWDSIKTSLNSLLRTKSPESIRVALMNILSGRMMSNYFKGGSEGLGLVKLHYALKDGYGFPEKANLIVALYKGVN